MKELVEFLAQSLVKTPNAVDVREVETERGLLIELRVDSTDMGAIIGRRGRTANALRSIVSAASKKNDRLVRLEIVD